MKNLLLVLLCIPLMAFGWDSDADDKLKEKAKEKYIARFMDYRQQIAGLEREIEQKKEVLKIMSIKARELSPERLLDWLEHGDDIDKDRSIIRGYITMENSMSFE